MPSIVSDMRPLEQMMMSPSGVVSATERHNELCTLQADLIKMASDKCATEDFEGAWKRCSAVGFNFLGVIAHLRCCLHLLPTLASLGRAYGSISELFPRTSIKLVTCSYLGL
ncbi:hypothetical protein BOTBODRAFT_471769 [Botryobasidium botryosum FD-172 SS1]|uniref:Uncharacterized protein n=1 Tax=Botryobasidium botryosum (strain FD-172 SS1) TaxID=930990 RepID=A0A067M553_BOTB1|nr:hypothetical protein BOTBODRAFT_471769 [Botryobasidium botryosum FD-172 SS1]